MADQEDFAERFERLKGKECRVHDIEIKGYKRTRTSIIEREFKTVREAKTLDELKDTLLDASTKLSELDIFHSVDIFCDAGPEDLPGTTNLIVTVSEKDVHNITGGYYIQGSEQSVEGSVKLRNFFGSAETWELNAGFGNQKSTAYTASFLQPRVFGGESQVEMRAFKTENSNEKSSSFVEGLTGFSTHFYSGDHELAYEWAWRLLSPTKLASQSVRDQAGYSLKSALKYSYMLDARNNPYIPTRGYAFRFNTEVAGLGPGSSLERPKRDFLGGDLMMNATAAFTFEFPHRLFQDMRARGQAFVSAGNIMGVGMGISDTKKVANDFKSSFRVSAGVGVVMPSPLGRIEINYCQVIRRNETDRIRQGLQIGIFPIGSI
eukprot:gene11570-13669_t